MFMTFGQIRDCLLTSKANQVYFIRFENYQIYTKTQMKETILQNVDLSSQVIVFDQQTRQGELTITNRHATLGVVFKIKATKPDMIEVKPAKGLIKPQNKTVISFKLSGNMSKQQMQSAQSNDKFLIQFLNIVNQLATREQVQGFWKAYKNNTANLQHGYGCYRVFMNLTGKQISRSNVKSQTISSKLYKTNAKASHGQWVNFQDNKSVDNRNQATDQQMSKKYTDLKLKEQQLSQNRQNIFKPTAMAGTANPSKLKPTLLFIIFFILAFIAGNYVRSSMVKVIHVDKLKQQKKSYFDFFK